MVHAAPFCFEVVDGDGETEKAILSEEAKVFTNPETDNSVVLTDDKLKLEDEKTGEVLYETESQQEVLLPQEFDATQVRLF